MNFCLDTRAATDHFPGIGRYVVNLARAMIPLIGGDERLILLHDPTGPSRWNLTALANERVHVVDAPISPFSLRQQWAIPRILRRLGADLYHAPYYLMPYRPGKPTILTLHDLIPLLLPDRSTMRARLFFRWTIAAALRTADALITVSEATRQDLLARFHVSPHRVVPIPEAADPAFRPRLPAEVKAVRRKYGLTERYVLYLGINKPHKNLTRLVEAWALITQYATRNTLLIAGAWDPRYPEPRQRAEALGLENSIRFLGPVPEADLPAIYSGATAFVFPSLYEGFGLPVLEAMACGTPVACSNTSSLPEVVGNAALTFNPTDTAGIAGAIAHLLDDGDLRAELRQRGLARAAEFSWKRTAQETLKLYREVLS